MARVGRPGRGRGYARPLRQPCAPVQNPRLAARLRAPPRPAAPRAPSGLSVSQTCQSIRLKDVLKATPKAKALKDVLKAAESAFSIRQFPHIFSALHSVYRISSLENFLLSEPLPAAIQLLLQSPIQVICAPYRLSQCQAPRSGDSTSCSGSDTAPLDSAPWACGVCAGARVPSWAFFTVDRWAPFRIRRASGACASGARGCMRREIVPPPEQPANVKEPLAPPQHPVCPAIDRLAAPPGPRAERAGTYNGRL